MHNTLLIAIKAALKAGKEIMNIYEDPTMDFQVEKKADNSPLTIADKKAHEAIYNILKNTTYPILSEEGKSVDYSTRKSWKTLWIVDPLDGTKEFIKKNGEFTVNIALVQDGLPIMGVIYVPVKQDLYFGSQTLGAYKISNITSINSTSSIEELIDISTKLPLAKTDNIYRVVASRSHLSAETETFIADEKKMHPEIELLSKGSSIKICLVAEGDADIYPRFAPTMEWDTAARDAIARAAGMKVCYIDRTTPLQYNKEDLLNHMFIVERDK